MKLSVVIPAFNEAQTIARVIERVRAVPYVTEIIVVDDASTDGTWAQVETVSVGNGIVALRHEQNRGKGAALRTGFSRVTGDYRLTNPFFLLCESPAIQWRVVNRLRVNSKKRMRIRCGRQIKCGQGRRVVADRD
ncbi:MAG: glycosyltransferase family 2 protein [Candidatus Hydrogenedentes bacterium]|nr:glycosyltransferase family 2 protein [Candidatus Hydrogenedentota bacterium]